MTAICICSVVIVLAFNRSGWVALWLLGMLQLTCCVYQDGNESSDGGGSISDLLPAYFQIVELSSLLGVGRDVIDYAMQLFRGCLLAPVPPKLSVEALATAALMQAIQDEQEQHTLQVENTPLDHLLVPRLHDMVSKTFMHLEQSL